MVNKKIVTIFLLLFLITSTISCVYADDDDRSYSITQALVDIIVDTNGMLHINETFDYSFDGTFNGVYRDIPLKEGESISNIHVSAEGAYTKVEQHQEDGTQHIKIYLYSDAINYVILYIVSKININILCCNFGALAVIFIRIIWLLDS